jgi:hypothetical protein
MKLTTDEIALLRAIVRWRREMAIEYVAPGQLLGEYRDSHGVRVLWDHVPEPEVGFTRNARTQPIRWVAVDTLAETVDVLVAFGFLPSRFSSAYRDGWDARDGLGDRDSGWTDEDRPELAPAIPQ